MDRPAATPRPAHLIIESQPARTSPGDALTEITQQARSHGPSASFFSKQAWPPLRMLPDRVTAATGKKFPKPDTRWQCLYLYHVYARREQLHQHCIMIVFLTFINSRYPTEPAAEILKGRA